jgi:aminoglycoside phosphotransferase (APT) family kinase protein
LARSDGFGARETLLRKVFLSVSRLAFYARSVQASEARRAVGAAKATITSLGLAAEDAITLHDSNKLTLRLLPCNLVARVARSDHQLARFEIDLAQRLAESDSPVAVLDRRLEPRVYERDGYVLTFWTYYPPAPDRELSPTAYAGALKRLHAGMRGLEVPSPHFTDRVEQAQQLVAMPDRTPELADRDRELLSNTLRSLRRVIAERAGSVQLLHGEPHPGNVLNTEKGPLFIDFETCCRGPVEFDVAHAPEEACEHYSNADPGLVGVCRLLVLAMIAAWRWERGDQLPNGRQLGTEWISQLRAALARTGRDLQG